MPDTACSARLAANGSGSSQTSAPSPRRPTTAGRRVHASVELLPEPRRTYYYVAIELDEHGAILDGHHRQAIADELGIECPSVTRVGMSEPAKREHAIRLNLARRQLDPFRWGLIFDELLTSRGIASGQGARNDRRSTSATVAEVASELGVAPRTARYRLRVARDIRAEPDLAAKVSTGEIDPRRALRIRRDREAQRRREQKESQARPRPSGGEWARYDHWASPRSWLSMVADRIAHSPYTAEANAHRGQKLRYYRFDGDALFRPGPSGEDKPAEVAEDATAMAGLEEARALSKQFGMELERREAELQRWITEQRRTIAEPIRRAAEAASDEATILIGRARVQGSSLVAYQVDIRNAGSEQSRTAHVDGDDCICGNGLPLGCRRILAGEAAS